jgi:hypothetical protein
MIGNMELGDATTEVIEQAKELVAQAEFGAAMSTVLDGLAVVMEDGANDDDLAALTQAVQEIEARLAAGVEDAEGLIAAELDWVRALLRLWEVRESAPGGRLASDTGGMAVSRVEAAGVFGRIPSGKGAEGVDEARREAALLRGRNDRWIQEAVLAGGFSVPVHELTARLGLSDVDAMIVLVLAAPALDPSIDRAYRWAWQDFTQKNPDVGFVRDLIDVLAPDTQTVPDRLLPSSTLIRTGVVTIHAPADRVGGGLIHHQLALASSVVEFLRGRTIVGTEGGSLARLQWSERTLDELVVPEGLRSGLTRLYPPGDGPFPHKALLVGGRGAGKKTLSGAVAWEGSRPILTIELHGLGADPAAAGVLLAAAVRDARMHRAFLYIDIRRAASDLDTAPALAAVIGRGLADTEDLPVAVGARSVSEVLFEEVEGLCEIPVTGYGTDELLALWRSALGRRNLTPPEEDVIVGVACQPGLTPGMIERAAAEVAGRAVASGLDGVSDDHLRMAVRNQVALGLAGVARRVSSAMDWDDFVLPNDTLERLEDIIVHMRYSDRVFDEWGFAGRFPYGKGLLCLFSGPPGTGKTMAAGVIAREIGVDLFQVDLSAVVSKWIGETEKTLARIFDEAQRARAALLFDEADSLFGRRTEQKTSTDRYGNLEVNYLLQRVETYEGLVILTSNFEQNIDEAFKRRLRFSIHFPFPNAEARARIWQVLLPSEADVADDIDFEEVAERFELAGGNIKNAVLRAAFDAAQSECAIGREQLIRAALEEYRGMGKLVRDED